MSIYGFGWLPDLPDHRDRRLMVSQEALLTAASSSDLEPGMPPVYDQDTLGSCTGNAISGAMQYERIKQGLHNYTPSRLFIYYNERVMEGTIDSDAGAMIRDGIKSVNRIGACAESLWPYDVSKFITKPTAYCYEVAPYDAVLAYARVNQTIADMRACLSMKLPFVFGFTVYESFQSHAVAQTGIVPMPLTTEQVLGGHAVVACGHDDALRKIKVRNSWGPNWGQRGYFWLPYDYISSNDLADDFWNISHVGKQVV